MPISQRIVQACLFIAAAIALTGGLRQMYLGQPGTTVLLDSLHRYLAGVYLGCGIIVLWAGITVRQQGTLVYLIALMVLLAGVGRAVSMVVAGVPAPVSAQYGYLATEVILAAAIAIAHRASQRG